MALNDTLDQIDFIDVFRPFCPKVPEYVFFSSAHVFFSSAHGSFSRIDHTLGHKISLNKFRKIKRLKCKTQTIQILKKENIGCKISDISHSNIFF